MEKRKILIIVVLLISQLGIVKAQQRQHYDQQFGLTKITSHEGWNIPLTVVNEGTNGSWEPAIQVEVSHRHNSAFKYLINEQEKFNIGGYGITSKLPMTIKGNSWVLKLNNDVSSNGTCMGTSSRGAFIITRTSDNYQTYTNALAIFNNGNVAINTIEDKGYRFAVNGTVGVNGTITATRLEIREPEIVWPDYVFKKEYNLMSLSDLDQYLKTNSHLPNVPSSKEIKEKGIEVGKMNKILLEKVEELTLYVIQLKKEIDKVKNSK